MSSDLSLASSLAREGGALIRSAFGAEAEVRYKSAEQPVTETDMEVDRLLAARFEAERPGDGWLSEESGRRAGASGRSWVVDPLDGTWNFVQGRPGFAVCIGLVERGTPILGVVYNPVDDVLYHAVRGEGAFRNGQRMRAAEYPNAGRVRLVVSTGEIEKGRFAEMRAMCEVETVGSTALKVMRVAEGAADLYLSGTDKGVWDVCAPSVIAEEAGAHVRSLVGEPLSFDLTEQPVRGLIVIGPGGESAITEIPLGQRAQDRRSNQEETSR